MPALDIYTFFSSVACNHSHFSESNLERAKFSQERVHDSGLRLTLRHAKVIAHKTSCQVEHGLGVKHCHGGCFMFGY